MNEIHHLNSSWYIEINNFARHTSFAHGFLATYANLAGLGILALLLLLAWWFARYDSSPALAVSRVLWAAGGTVVAWLLTDLILKPEIAEKRPYFSIHYVETHPVKIPTELLRPITHEFSLPSGHATIAGGVIVGLWLARRRIIAFVATVAGLLLAFARVYVGLHYPFDVIGGIVFGGLVVGLLSLVAVPIINRIVKKLMAWPATRPLVSGGRRSARFVSERTVGGNYGTTRSPMSPPGAPASVNLVPPAADDTDHAGAAPQAIPPEWPESTRPEWPTADPMHRPDPAESPE